MRDDMLCPHCGSVNDFASSYLGILGDCEHHRCRWYGARRFVDEIEDGFDLECEHMVEFIKLIEEDPTC
jgi:hypothetical protein